MTFNKTGPLFIGFHWYKCGFWNFKLLIKIAGIVPLRPCYTRQFFLQLVSQRWRLKNIASCRGGVTRSQYFFATCNAPGGNCLQLFLRQLEIFCEQKTGSDCLIFTKLPCRFRWTYHTQDISTFLPTRNATFCCRCRLQNWGVTREIFLATCLATKSCKKNCLV